MDNIYNLWNDDDEQSEASIIVYYNIKMLIKDAAKTSSKREKENIKEIYGNNDEKPPVRIFVLYKDTFVQRGSSGRIAINRRRNSGLLKSNAQSPFVSILIFWYSSRPNRDEIEKFPNNFAFNKSNTRNGERDKFIKNVSPNYEKESVDSTFRITFVKHGDSSEAYEIDVVATSNGCRREVRYRYSQKPVPGTSDELNRQKKQNYGNVDDHSGNFRLKQKPTNEDYYVGSEMYYENLKHENGSDDIISETNHEALKHDLIGHSISQSKHDSESNDDSSRKVYEIFKHSNGSVNGNVTCFPNFAFNKSNTRNGERDKFIKNVSPNYEKESVDSTFRITFVKHGDSSEAYEIDVVATCNGCRREVGYRYSQKPVPGTSDELNRQKKQNYGNVDDHSGNFRLKQKPTNEDDYVGSEMYYENLKHENGSDDIISETNHEALKHDLIGHSISQSKHDSESNDDSSRKVYEIFKHSNGSVNGNVTCFPKISIHDLGSDDISSEKNLRNLEQKQDYGEISGNKNGVNVIHDKKSDGARISPGKCYQNSRRTSGSLQDNPETLNPYLDSNFDSVDYFNDVDEIAFEKSGFGSLAIFAMLLKTIAIIVEEYSENDTKGNKNSKNGRGTKFRMVMIPSEIFEEAMRQCHIATVELTYSNIFPSDCRMFVCVPIYRNGYIHRKDQM